MNLPLRASIVINTYNRAPYLRRLLAGLSHLRQAEFEVVVVNGPSTDETENLFLEYSGRLKIVTCPERNLSYSRNLGIAASAGEVVLFIDDDALPADELWLARYLQAFEADAQNRLGAIGGPVQYRDTHWFEFAGGLTSDYGFQQFIDHQSDSFAPDGSAWQLRVQGCNCAFRREALEVIGGFDEFFRYYHDETDLCLRLARSGYNVAYIAENGVRHYAAGSERRASKYDRNWDVITRSDTYFALKNGHHPQPARLFKTLAAAPRKHFIQEIHQFFRQGEISFFQWLKFVMLWLRGLASGLWAGLTQPRRLGGFSQEPPPFLPFTSPARAERPLTIALLTQTIPGQPGFGGVGRYTFDLARGLHERGHTVHIVCKDEQEIQHLSLGLTVHGLPASSYRAASRSERPIVEKNIAYSRAVVRKLQALYAQGVEFDVVHATNWDHEALALIRARLYPVALMLVTPLAQAITANGWNVTDDLRLCVELDRWQIEQADVVCAPSRGILDSYRSSMDLSAEVCHRTEITPLGIVPAAHQEGARRPGLLRLLFVGRLERRKGIHTLLAVLPTLLEAFPNWECHIVGDDSLPAPEGGTYRSSFLTRHQGERWLSRVVFHGAVSEAVLQRHYRECDLFVAPSLFESFGLIYHEAMQYGKAVVGCQTGGVPEVVTHGAEGLLVTPDAQAELEAALSRLMRDAEARERMGRAGAERVHHAMNYRTMAARLEQAYGLAMARVGEARKARRREVWQRELPLFSPTSEIVMDGPWETREGTPGQHYRLGLPGARLRFQANGGTKLRLVAIKHPWSGVLAIHVDGQKFGYLNLYQPEQADLHVPMEMTLPGSPDQPVHVELCVHPERHPGSLGNQVWLKSISANVAYATA
jgi:hypothetical protein